MRPKLRAMKISNLLLVLLAATALAACGSDSEWGRISLGITDAPVDDAAHVVVRFTGVELRHEDGSVERFTFETPRDIDLLALQGGGVELLIDDAEVPAGRYDQIRLTVDAGLSDSTSYIEYHDGTQFPLFIPSGNEAGLRIVNGFVVPAGGLADFTIDFDLRRSVTRPPGLGPNHILRPTLRLVDNAEVGSIAGLVDEMLVFPPDATEDCAPAVYVFEGAGVEPRDVHDDEGPITSALVELDEGTGEYRYRAAFIAAGDYTVAFTCDADDDDAGSADDIVFTGGAADVSVTAGAETVVDFPVE